MGSDRPMQSPPVSRKIAVSFFHDGATAELDGASPSRADEETGAPSPCAKWFSDGVASHCAVTAIISAEIDSPLASDVSGTSSTRWSHVKTEPSLMQDVAKAMQHISSSDACSGALQMLQQADTEGEQRSCCRAISCKAFAFLLALMLVVLLVAQWCPTEIYIIEERAASQRLAERTRHLRSSMTRRGEAPAAASIDEYLASVEAYDAELQRRAATASRAAALILIGMASAAVAVAALGGSCAASQLRQLTSLSVLAQLRQRNQPPGTASESPVVSTRRSCIWELRSIQDAFGQLSIGIDRFARFVPESVVSRIIQGERRAARLHVDRKEVTIMFSDIQDFTAITEQLSQSNARNLLFLLTRYFTVMSQVIEAYDGSVGEILGDGILAFWNTPNYVARHQSKACMAAVVMQQALKYLSAEYEMLGLPSLKIRVGIHTGWVLTGNIGSFRKMKFGCIGDPMNVAARLEGLCKMYSVNIICSGECHKALLESDGFVSRQLDYVQVKGREKAMKIFEVMGVDFAGAGAKGMPAMSDVLVEAIGTLSSDPECAYNLMQATRWNGSPVSGVAPPAGERTRISTAATAGSLDSRRFATEDSEGHGLPPKLPTPQRFDLVSPRKKTLSKTYEDALVAFQKGRFQQARELAQEILRQAPNDVPAAKLLARSDLCLEEGIANDLSNWKGVAVMTDK